MQTTGTKNFHACVPNIVLLVALLPDICYSESSTRYKSQKQAPQVSLNLCYVKVLKKGGHWINLGPLLYHFSDIPGTVFGKRYRILF
jgi:hypothetical protein